MLKDKWKQKLDEEAAGGSVGAGAVAGVHSSLFSGIARRNAHTNAPKVTKLELNAQNEFNDSEFNKQMRAQRRTLKKAFDRLSSVREGVDFSDSESIIDKLKGIERDNSSQHQQDMVIFGLDDIEGNIVKVSIPKDQAADFETELRDHIKMGHGEGDDQIEIAELLYQLKDRFDILDVDWGEIEENEEQMPDGEADALALDGEADLAAADELDMSAPPEGDNVEDVTSLLTQVISMMKADAKARETEAEAKKAEAEVKKAQAAAKQAYAKVRQEEQILDMEDYESAEKVEARETKRLAKLAKWRHEISNGALDSKDLMPGSDIEDDPEYEFSVHDDFDDDGEEVKVNFSAREENNEVVKPSPQISYGKQLTAPIVPGAKGTTAEFMTALLTRLKSTN